MTNGKITVIEENDTNLEYEFAYLIVVNNMLNIKSKYKIRKLDNLCYSA